MKHIFKQGTNSRTLLLLHGTGGNEEDLLPLAEFIDPEASVLGVRGNVLENGMPRFFKRLAQNVFDEEDLVFRTNELHAFLDEASDKYGFSRSEIVAVGYSNGANIAGSLLFHHVHALKGAILFHPMVPIRGVELPDLSSVPIFIGAGKNDPLIPPKETLDLLHILTKAGARTEVYWESNGHALSQTEASEAAKWYGEFLKIS